ncbi:Zn(2)-C6 fungal-type domain-containing protein [Fusarium keratoplasticum]|uniref:Zn(2)-C6 fungal-type domain-containing protein n=1 Tax=Fusarium keratoplasticum TaxID=1328300 RepID=A0ACC0QKF5_9HYPO|nr:Zn(2)-C6 fungal-type domain-containing protein [Fusarium keratoplasticum]KAI8657116.1 Zn(2)-C6 fungal-type domain-containing protein [Fusarium keratoplasticum]KAI8658094.1 Zn(2)-C6 fungal-type domain-containing protein [Fusarium keratoplasticum]
MSSTSFPTSQYFPPRRRVWQACTNCRARKTRCDAAKPKCSLCVTQNVACVYRDSQQPKIEANTLILLERIQLLEDRIFAAPGFGGGQDDNVTHQPPGAGWQGGGENDAPEMEPQDFQILIPLSHTACANHVFNWPIVRQLLSDIAPTRTSHGNVLSTEATDIFFQRKPDQEPKPFPPESWRISVFGDSFERYRRMLDSYFAEVNVFFPLLSHDEMLDVLHRVSGSEGRDGEGGHSVSPARYCLLLLVLCLGDLAPRKRPFRSPETGEESQDSPAEFPYVQLWQKAQLLMGHISSDLTLEATQCAMLASIYMGARGQVSDSFHWAHATAVKCEALAKRTLIGSKEDDVFSEAFRRLYWVAFIFEGDFVSEISITLPSGIARYEDLVPYPIQGAPRGKSAETTTPRPEPASLDPAEELVAFQISTNAAIRRFLNHVNSVVYDSKDHFRMTRTNYANWLLRTTDDLWSYHSTIYRNLPDVLLSRAEEQQHPGEEASPGTSRRLGNHAWNIVRLQGRYYAGQYIVHRPFIEYVLLNVGHFHTHPCKEAILERCRMCLEGCKGFIGVFDANPVNRITSLFASGMVTFTMVMILRIATFCDVLREILPGDIEETILVGKRNLRKFGVSVGEFGWHLEVLEKLDAACRERMAAR